jgi:hypothetical protein
LNSGGLREAGAERAPWQLRRIIRVHDISSICQLIRVAHRPLSTKGLAWKQSEPQAINYSITREKAPIYTMGLDNCRSYSRYKRGIASGLIWINFDRHSLLALFKKARGKFLADVDEIRPQYQDSTVGAQAVFTSSLVRTVGPSIGGTIDQLDNLSVSEVGGSKELADPWYSDQILPFDVTIAGANEYGAMAAAKIFGIEILNEGWGSSIDDAVSEMQATFVGRAGGPMQVYRPSPSFSSRLTPLPRTAPTGSTLGHYGKSLFISHIDREVKEF